MPTLFRADGVGVQKHEDGSRSVKAVFVNEQTGKKMFEQTFRGPDAASIKGQIDLVLTKLKTAETDTALQAEYVGKTISTIDG